jgi:hypothetical protein
MGFAVKRVANALGHLLQGQSAGGSHPRQQGSRSGLSAVILDGQGHLQPYGTQFRRELPVALQQPGSLHKQVVAPNGNCVSHSVAGKAPHCLGQELVQASTSASKEDTLATASTDPDLAEDIGPTPPPLGTRSVVSVVEKL